MLTARGPDHAAPRPPMTGWAGQEPGCWHCLPTTSPGCRCLSAVRWPARCRARARPVSRLRRHRTTCRGRRHGLRPPLCLAGGHPVGEGARGTGRRRGAAELDAVLLGGGPAPAPVLAAASDAGIAVVRTYGSSETVEAAASTTVCRWTGSRYASTPRTAASRSVVAPWRRVTAIPRSRIRSPEPGWFRTDDVGAVDDSGRSYRCWAD